jgi:hypothetical protein
MSLSPTIQAIAVAGRTSIHGMPVRKASWSKSIPVMGAVATFTTFGCDQQEPSNRTREFHNPTRGPSE